jgi:hypothetical protein
VSAFFCADFLLPPFVAANRKCIREDDVTTLVGAIAYKLSEIKEVSTEASWWDRLRQFVERDKVIDIACPHCGERYGLVEEPNVTSEVLEQDTRFLTKGLESVHPDHPSCVVVRDPKGALWKLLGGWGCAGVPERKAA